MDRVDQVKHLKREKREAEAIPILLEWVEETEEDQLGVAPWPYEQLAIVYRKLGREDDERLILERFAKQKHSPGAAPAKLIKRLVKVYDRQGHLELRDGEDGPVHWHLEYESSIDEVPPYRRLGLVLDTETTGLSGTDELIEFGGILFSFSLYSGKVIEVMERYGGFREPNCAISSGARRVHGIKLSDLQGKRLDERRIQGMIQGADFLIAHNASFDRRFLLPLFPAASDKRWHCSMRGCSWKEVGFPSAKLDEILEHAGVVRQRTHRALDDAEGLLELLGTRPEPTTNETYLLRVVKAAPLKPGRRTPKTDVRKVPVVRQTRKEPQGCLSVVAILLTTMLLMIVAIW